MVALNDSYFDLFGLPAQFELDSSMLDAAYHAVQVQVHPDRFVAAGSAQQRVAMQWALRVNEAYQALRDPLRRAIYLLELRGVELDVKSNTAMTPAFLLEQIEWREGIEDAVAANDAHGLDVLRMRLGDEKRQRCRQIAGLFESGADQQTIEAVRQLMFIERLSAEIDAQLERLES